MKTDYICKIADLSEMERKWDDEIARAGENRANWAVWKTGALRNREAGWTLPYYGILKGEIICEATAHLCPKTVQNAEGLVDERTAYLSAFRTVPAYQGQGYFSRLFRFMLDDLRGRGYEAITVGVEPQDETNRAIYAHYGFDRYLKTAVETYPDQTTITVDYYRKKL